MKRKKKEPEIELRPDSTSFTPPMCGWQESSTGNYGVIRIDDNKIRWIFPRTKNG